MSCRVAVSLRSSLSLLPRTQSSKPHGRRVSLTAVSGAWNILSPSSPPSLCSLCSHSFSSFSSFARHSQRRSFRPVSSPRQRRWDGPEGIGEEKASEEGQEGIQHLQTSPSSRPPTEQEEYEKELRLLLEQQATAAATSTSSSASSSPSSAFSSSSASTADESIKDDIPPQLSGFFDPLDDVEKDADVAAFSDPSSSLSEPLRRLYSNRMIRLKSSLRPIVSDVLMQQPALLSLPLHCHSTRVSTDLQHITIVWHLSPIRPSSSLIRLPSSFRGRALMDVIREVQVILERSVGKIRQRLAAEVEGKYVPHVRFIFDDSERQRKKEVIEQQRTSAQHKISNTEGDIDTRQLEDFQHYNPFWTLESHLKKKRKSQVESMKPAVGGQRKESAKQRRQREQREKWKEVRRTGVVNGEKRFAVPLGPGLGQTGKIGKAGKALKGKSLASLIAQQKQMRDI